MPHKKNKNNKAKILAGLASLLGLGLGVGQTSSAAAISYTPTSLGGTAWQYDYTVANDTLGAALEEFTIFYALGVYDTISIVGTPTGWDGLAIEPDPGIPDDGFADYLALTGGLSAGATQGGFQVSFNYLGQGTPGGQPFTVIDPLTFETLESGTTRQATTEPPPTQVPEPGTLGLLGLGLAGLVLARRRAAQVI